MTLITDSGQTIGPIAVPSDGVVYVQNGTGCSTAYSPFTATYPPSSGCGNAIVDTGGSTYSGQLTIAAENDVIIDGDIRRIEQLGRPARPGRQQLHPDQASRVCPTPTLTPTAPAGRCARSVTAEAAKGDCNTDNDGNRAGNGNGTTSNITDRRRPALRSTTRSSSTTTTAAAALGR